MVQLICLLISGQQNQIKSEIYITEGLLINYMHINDFFCRKCHDNN